MESEPQRRTLCGIVGFRIAKSIACHSASDVGGGACLYAKLLEDAFEVLVHPARAGAEDLADVAADLALDAPELHFRFARRNTRPWHF